MAIVCTLMGTPFALSVIIEQAEIMLFTIECPKMSLSKDQPNGCKNETSLRKLTNSIGYTEMETLYASHILQAMEFLKESR
tara:strand:- start:5 stop:247 length:243 start_codon:yes stop_codon:yes gene_type:complete